MELAQMMRTGRTAINTVAFCRSWCWEARCRKPALLRDLNPCLNKFSIQLCGAGLVSPSARLVLDSLFSFLPF